jgi:hypothetical protein
MGFAIAREDGRKRPKGPTHPTSCRPRESGDPSCHIRGPLEYWVPAYAGMTVSCAARERTTRHEGASPRLTDATGAGPCYPYSQCQTARCRMCPAPTLSILFEPQFFSNRSSLRSRGACGAPGILPLVATPEGMAERRQAPVPCSRAARVRRGAHLAIGALASRRSAVTVLGRASPALRFRHCRRHRREGLAAGALIEPWRRHPTSRTALRRDATPAPPSGSPSGDAPHRAGCVTHTPASRRSQ